MIFIIWKLEYKMAYQGMKFCQECNNMLYPREDAEEKVLVYFCKNCPYYQKAKQSEAMDNCVYRTERKLDKVSIIIDPECCLDPTLSRTKDTICSKCGYNEAVFFQNPAASESDVGMNLIFVCARYDEERGKACGNYWSQAK